MQAGRGPSPDESCALPNAAFFVLLDLAGMMSFAVGALWFFDGFKLIPGFPAGTPSAAFSLAGGFLLIAAASRRVRKTGGAGRS
jgi:hypothetical protein